MRFAYSALASFVLLAEFLDYGFHHLGIRDGNGSDSAFTPRASIRFDRFWSTILYRCVSEPRTGSRKSFAPSSTNQTGTEIVFPDFLPMTLILIWRYG